MQRLVVAFACASPVAAQSLDEVRRELSQTLHDSRVFAAMDTLVWASDELEFSSAQYDFDDDSGTQLKTVALPFQTTFHPWGECSTGLYVEGVLGQATAHQSADDLFDGQVPGFETSIEADWKTYGALVGVGPSFRLSEEISVTPILNLGAARIESEATYGGPGAAATAPLLDGIAFNWRATTITQGTAARVDWARSLSDDIELQTVGRYDLRWTRTVEADDAAQRFSSRQQVVTLSSEAVGPTGVEPFGRPLKWHLSAGYRHFLERSLFDVRDMIEVGGALELDVADHVPLLGSITIGAALFHGEDLDGWSAGISASL